MNYEDVKEGALYIENLKTRDISLFTIIFIIQKNEDSFTSLLYYKDKFTMNKNQDPGVWNMYGFIYKSSVRVTSDIDIPRKKMIAKLFENKINGV